MGTITGGGARSRLARAIEAGPAGLALMLAGSLRERGLRRLDAARDLGERGAVSIEYIIVGVVVGAGAVGGAGLVINALNDRFTALSSEIVTSIT